MKKSGGKVNVFKKKGSNNYYFQVMINGRRVVESTRESDIRKASKKAEERRMELKLELDYTFYLKKVLKLVETMGSKEKNKALLHSITELNKAFDKRVLLEEAFDLFKKNRENGVLHRQLPLPTAACG